MVESFRFCRVATPTGTDAGRSDERDRVHPRRGFHVRGGPQIHAPLPLGRQRLRVRDAQLPFGTAGVREHRRRDRTRQQRSEGSSSGSEVDPTEHRRVRRQPRRSHHCRHVGRRSQRSLSLSIAHVSR